MIGEGFYLTESDCREAIWESDSGGFLTVREFTPREAVVEIHRLAEAGE